MVCMSPYQTIAQTSELNARFMACRVIGDVTARAACYDRLVDGMNQVPAPVAAAPRAPSPPPTAAVPAAPTAAPRLTPPAPESKFGAESLPLQKRDPGAVPSPDQIIAKAVSVRIDGSGFVIVTLANGQTWRQTEGPELRILPGAEVRIRSALLGSYLMSLASGNRSVRAKRVN